MNVASGNITVTESDNVKTFFHSFKEHLGAYSPTSQMTINKTARLATVCLLGSKSEEEALRPWSGGHIYDRLIAALLPGGIFEKKAVTCSASYCHMVISSMNKIVEFCKQSDKYVLTQSNETSLRRRIAKALVMYHRLEVGERAENETKKRKDVADMDTIRKLVKSEWVQGVLTNAQTGPTPKRPHVLETSETHSLQ